jgi:CRISPR-associated endonuclease/helicase Cas3
MIPDDFSGFYEAVHGYPPYPWQVRLLHRVSTEGWPKTIDLPTSSGKTSAIDVAVFHLAMEAGLPERSARLRTFFVIDRRVVVDQATEHATQIAMALLKPQHPVVAEVARRLRNFGGELPLGVSALRGGMYRDNTWADEPNQPLICVSTVDQVGSRLLFRGYQVGEGSRSIHAGLVGNDSLLIVDEAHLSKPFMETLNAVNGRYAKYAERRLPRGLTVVQMSATVSAQEGSFRLQDSDLANPVLLARLEASKAAQLREPAKKFEDEVAQSARELSKPDDVHVIGVVVNTVAAARAIYKQLSGKAVLLIGRNRPSCAQKLWDEYKPRIEANTHRVRSGKLFVVATQTVEVGANLDFDALVTESAPLDALRQRFGRLDRLGLRKKSSAAIVLRSGVDPVYGDATARTWAFMSKIPDLDFGVLAMRECLNGVDVTPYCAERLAAPHMFPVHLEFWAQTNPTPSPDPEVAPFLHGPEALDAADVQIVWRADLREGEPETWEGMVAVAPPVSMEALGLPVGAVRRWLRLESSDAVDVEGVALAEKEAKRPAKMRAALVWRGADSERNSTDPGKIRPGDTIVVPASYGGCDEFGWSGDSQHPAEDIGDMANNLLAEAGMRQFRARLSLLNVPEELRKRAIGGDEADADEEALQELARLARIPTGVKWRLDSTKRVITWPGKRVKQRWSALPDETDEDDSSSVGREDRAVTLRAHTAGVVVRARRYADHCGLTREQAEDIQLAAQLHDLGKWDDRFQAWLHSGSLARALKAGEPLAKSAGRKTSAEVQRLREVANYPKGGRHEAASVTLACASGWLSTAHDRDLVLHLIGTHHGYGRPLFPVWDEEDNIQVFAQIEGREVSASTGRELARIDSGWVDRFWSLNRKYGYWGLAYLETILRRADCMQSREEQAGE